jgi:transcriptional regulator with XRE-family HTH domain
MSITPEQAKAARTLLGWTQRQLAGKLLVGHHQVGNYERRKRHSSLLNLARLRGVFESAGVEFTEANPASG